MKLHSASFMVHKGDKPFTLVRWPGGMGLSAIIKGRHRILTLSWRPR